ncbi:PEPxxWA-CTERM sorting domain-containing protein [Sphingomonas sp.]|uniref:Npun_F0296 family exosortase-dependent surface protein n=1 Tax=Sphingomonas sp. TaxID=28214 RepID=UPI002DEB5E8E|nr:PEPxxWA-CTERM sorting domain-containing protein [Sphingomonas sp.]
MTRLLIAGITSALLAGSASAAITVSTSTSGTNPASDPGYAGLALIYDFDTKSPAAGNLTGDFKIEVAPGTGIAAAPAGTPAGTKFLTVPNSTSTGSADLLLGGEFSKVSFYWGSIDDYNTLQLLDKFGMVIHSVTGLGLPAPVAANGNQSAPTSNRRVTFASTSRNIAGLRLSSTNYAFEIDSVAGAVPEPATWAMMLGGFGLLGAAARRRRTVASVLA